MDTHFAFPCRRSRGRRRRQRQFIHFRSRWGKHKSWQDANKTRNALFWSRYAPFSYHAFTLASTHLHQSASSSSRVDQSDASVHVNSACSKETQQQLTQKIISDFDQIIQALFLLRDGLRVLISDAKINNKRHSHETRHGRSQEKHLASNTSNTIPIS